MIFRPMTPGEEAALMALWTDCKQAPHTLWNEDYPGAEEAAFDIANGHAYGWFDETGALIGCISMEEDECVGLPCCAGDSLPSVELSRVGIAGTHRGQGLAARLTRRMLAELNRLGIRTAHLLVSPENLPARRAYERAGFQPVGETDMWGIHWLVMKADPGRMTGQQPS